MNPPRRPEHGDERFAQRLTEMSKDNMQASEKVTRVIDFRIPLPYLISGALVVIWAMTSMYFSVQQLVRDVNDLQITVKAGNGQATTVAGEMALLRFRVENLEGDRRLREKERAPEVRK